MQVNASTERALDYISRRAIDVANAYTPGAQPVFGDAGLDRAAAHPSADPLSGVLPAGALVIVAQGDGSRGYTRDLTFRVIDGTVSDAAGRPVLGFSNGSSLGPMHIDARDEALGRVDDLRLEPDGSIGYERTVVDPHTTRRFAERVVVGRIALGRFPIGTALGEQRGVLHATGGVVPHVGMAADGNFEPLRLHAREGSAIDFDRSLEKLHDAYIAFDAVEAAHKAQGAAGKTVLDLLK